MTIYYVKKFAAVVVAPDRVTAFNALQKTLKVRKNLHLDFKHINPTDFIQVDDKQIHCVLLDYD